MASFFGLNFGSSADMDIILENQDERKMAEIKDENGRKERRYLFYDGESVAGKVNITLHRRTRSLEHQGIKIEFIGQIELYYDRGNHHEFLSLVKELARPGEITQNTSYEFEFNQVEKPYECYTGANVRLRYFLRVSLVRRLTDMVKEMDLLVHTLATYPEMNNPIKMEVGIEECLHIEFEYNKSKYHLKDVIVGKIYFLLVRIKIKHMEIAIIKRETTGSGPNTFHDNETIAKYEIMDGAPVKGESIPIRVFLAGYDLTPTMRDINKKFSVKYFLNLVLVDEEERRYFKQQEITLWRKGERSRRPLHGSNSVNQQIGHQIPHAMARHNPGEFPSANVRTAPTPSGEEAEPAFAAAGAAAAAAAAAGAAAAAEDEAIKPPIDPRSPVATAAPRMNGGLSATEEEEEDGASEPELIDPPASMTAEASEAELIDPPASMTAEVSEPPSPPPLKSEILSKPEVMAEKQQTASLNSSSVAVVDAVVGSVVDAAVGNGPAPSPDLTAASSKHQQTNDNEDKSDIEDDLKTQPPADTSVPAAAADSTGLSPPTSPEVPEMPAHLDGDDLDDDPEPADDEALGDDDL